MNEASQSRAERIWNVADRGFNALFLGGLGYAAVHSVGVQLDIAAPIVDTISGIAGGAFGMRIFLHSESSEL